MSLMLPNINIYVLYRLSTSLTWSLREFISKLRVCTVSYLMIMVSVSIILATDPTAYTMDNSDLGIPLAKMNIDSAYGTLVVFGFVALDTTSLFFMMLLSLLTLRHIKNTERSITHFVNEQEISTIKDMHEHRRKTCGKRLMIILFIKLSWLPTSSTMLSIYMNAKPPKSLLITVFCLLLPVSMFFSPIFLICSKR